MHQFTTIFYSKKFCIRTIQGHIIVAGDLNARPVDWGIENADARGRRISEMRTRCDLIATKIGNPPIFRRPGCEGIIPDVTLVSERSDPKYIAHKLKIESVRDVEAMDQNTTTRRWNTKKMNTIIL